jgi:hypothetical protein
MKNLFTMLTAILFSVLDSGFDFISMARVVMVHFLTGQHFNQALGMKAKFGAIVVDGRGKIGGHVASKNRAGAYFRTKVTPSNPQTSAQSGVRSSLTLLSQSWQLLTDADRAAWNGAVASYSRTDIFGDLRNPSGFNLYLRLNLNILNAGGGIISNPPAEQFAPEPVAYGLEPDQGAGDFDVTFSPSPIPANTAYVIEATEQVSSGKSFAKNLFRVVQVLPAADVTPTNIFAAYTAKFGGLVPGKKIFMRVKAVNLVSGLASSPIVESAIVV